VPVDDRTRDKQLVPSSNHRESPLTGRYVRLEAITQHDYEWLFRIEVDSAAAARGRLRGQTPDPAAWEAGVWAGVLAQFMVVTGDIKPITLGVVRACNLNADGHAHITALRLGPDEPSPLFMLGLILFVEYVFTCWNLRKLYIEVPGWSYGQIASGEGKLFRVEGFLQEHYYFNGEFWDQYILAIRRSEWAKASPRLLGRTSPS
jgi:hypothetical protein